MSTLTCSAQRYWYDNGQQRAEYCGEPATRVITAMDGSTWLACENHAAMAVDAGARSGVLISVNPPHQVKLSVERPNDINLIRSRLNEMLLPGFRDSWDEVILTQEELRTLMTNANRMTSRLCSD